ncbi:hypothetical protein AVEN_234457-1 [Araneus ventricosus]|uniref:Reverse transcriptase domain-containing protein n=1 Tax=Araneus ventricosus TaxID=182803 RepID=A0A4Y2A9E6_ARAVE|nr:hypothetical protein AVEN_234457-1 [Araneus ventricosus]
MGIFKKKPNRRRGGFKFWNYGLRTLRNTTNKLYKIFKRKKQSDSPEAEVHVTRAEYNKSRAIYKKQLLIAKRESWEHFCRNCTHTFGSIFKMAFGKSKKVAEILVKPNDKSDVPMREKVEMLLEHFFPWSTSFLMENYTPELEHFQEFTEKEVGLVINNLKKGKAPGLDRLDYRIWTHIFSFYR